MAVGKVVKFDEVRGFGFITPNGGSEDVFLHANDLQIPESMVKPGVTVVFDIDEGERGLKASNIHLPDNAPRPAATASPHAAATPTRRPAVLDGDEGCDVLTADDFAGQVTELLLNTTPPLTGAQILDVRRRLADFADNHGWLEF